MAPFSIDRTTCRPPGRVVASLACALLLAACAAATAAPPHGRLDPTERQRLREDLRRQYPDERAFPQGGGDMPAHPDQPMHRRGPPGYAPGPGYRGVPGYGDAPAYGEGAPAWGDGRRHRMSPEEREQLRLMLRERREAARRRGGWDDDGAR